MKLKRLFSSLLAAAAAVCAVMPSAASADSLSGATDVITDGTFEYTKTDDGLIISKCTASIVVKIPDVQNGVRIIGIADNAFAGCTGLPEALVIPDTIKEIGNYAFMGCTSIKTLKLPKKLESLGVNAFFGCSSLEKTEVPESLGELPTGMFRQCDHLTEVVIPDNITKVGDYAFYQCTSLKEMTLPDSLVSVGEMAFGEMLSIAKFDTEGCNAFTFENDLLLDKDKSTVYCASSELTGEYYIPQTVTTIAPGAFSAAAGITDLFIPASVENIAYGAFSSQLLGTYGYRSALKHIDFAEGLKYIGEGAFSYCMVESLLFPSTLTDIGSGAFAGCPKLNRVVMADGLKNVGDGAFFFCDELKSITVPKSVVNIGDEAFGYTVGENDVRKLDDFKMSVSSGTAAEKYAKSNGISYTVSDKSLKRAAFVIVAIGLIAAAVVFGIVLMARSRKLASSGAKKAKKEAEEKAEEATYETILSDDDDE